LILHCCHMVVLVGSSLVLKAVTSVLQYVTSVRSWISTASLMRFQVFCHVMLCFPMFQQKVLPPPLLMKALRSLKMSRTTHTATQCHIIENLNPLFHVWYRGGEIKFRKHLLIISCGSFGLASGHI
jgi:hypothetical protein